MSSNKDKELERKAREVADLLKSETFEAPRRARRLLEMWHEATTPPEAKGWVKVELEVGDLTVWVVWHPTGTKYHAVASKRREPLLALPLCFDKTVKLPEPIERDLCERIAAYGSVQGRPLCVPKPFVGRKDEVDDVWEAVRSVL